MAVFIGGSVMSRLSVFVIFTVLSFVFISSRLCFGKFNLMTLDYLLQEPVAAEVLEVL
jgi:hypothetical protein